MAFEDFPIEAFPVEALRWRLLGMSASGGSTLGGPGQDAEFDGGGWWCAEMTGIDLGDGQAIRNMRALLLRSRGGVGRWVVRMVDDALVVLPPPVPHDDESPFDDDSLYDGNAIAATLVDDVGLRGTSYRIQCSIALTGGEAFSLTHPVHGRRIYMIAKIDEPEEGDAEDHYRVFALPALREAALAGDECDFDRPSCVMKLVDPGAESWPTVTPGIEAKAALRFEEAFDILT